MVLAVFMLAGCADEVIGDYIDQYTPPVQKEKLELDLYIVCEEGTTKTVCDTVQQRIESYTLTEFETAVKVHYFTAAEYEAKVTAAVKSDAEDKADIVLINSKSLMDKLLADKVLADLTGFFEGNKYGTLNKQIATSLLEAATVTEVVDDETVEKLYCVPNNHVVGKYEYLLVNKEKAREYFISDIDLAAFTTSDAANDLRALIEADGEDPDEFVKVVEGMYEDKAKYEAAGYACNVIKYPEATAEDAFSGAFAIVNASEEVVDRAMEIIYAINTDVTLHNYLTYGIPATNYSIDDNNNVTRNKEDNSAYLMSYLYTGDVFKSYYCEELGWTDESAEYGDLQNKDSVSAQ